MRWRGLSWIATESPSLFYLIALLRSTKEDKNVVNRDKTPHFYRGDRAVCQSFFPSFFQAGSFIHQSVLYRCGRLLLKDGLENEKKCIDNRDNCIDNSIGERILRYSKRKWFR